MVRGILDYRDEYNKQEEAGATAHMRPDNREIWALVRDADFVQRVPGRFAPIQVLPQLISLYLSVQDGECQVERDLGKMTAVLANHANISTPCLCDIVVLSSGGPASADELKGSGRELSVFLRECASLWIQRHGRRFGAYDSRKVREKEQRRQGTRVASKRGTRIAAEERAKLNSITKVGLTPSASKRVFSSHNLQARGGCKTINSGQGSIRSSRSGRRSKQPTRNLPRAGCGGAGTHTLQQRCAQQPQQRSH